LGDEADQVGVGGALDVERATAKIVQSLAVAHDSDIHVLEQGVARQHHVVRLSDGVDNLERGPDAEANLGLLAVVDGKALALKGAR
jgi:hypothetical protein